MLIGPTSSVTQTASSIHTNKSKTSIHVCGAASSEAAFALTRILRWQDNKGSFFLQRIVQVELKAIAARLQSLPFKVKDG